VHPSDKARLNDDRPEYTERLVTLSGRWWKRLLDVQRPYRWNLRRLEPGKTLEVGSGIGRKLKDLPAGSVGVDHNATSNETARQGGMIAFTPEEFHVSKYAVKEGYDSILLSHILEHMTPEIGVELLREYLPYLRKDGKVIVFCPQEHGYTTDASHVTFMDPEKIIGVFDEVGIRTEKSYSFPFPRAFGKVFTHNEFNVIGKK